MSLRGEGKAGWTLPFPFELPAQMGAHAHTDTHTHTPGYVPRVLCMTPDSGLLSQGQLGKCLFNLLLRGAIPAHLKKAVFPRMHQ